MALPKPNQDMFDPVHRKITHIVDSHQLLPYQAALQDAVWQKKLRDVQDIAQQLQEKDDSDFGKTDLIPASDVEKFLKAASHIFLLDGLWKQDTKLQLTWVNNENENIKGLTAMEGSTHMLRLHTTHNKSGLEVLCVLLHEMVHMFLTVCEQEELSQGHQVDVRLFGYSRHGYYWQRLARSIETRATYVLGLKIDLGRRDACLEELVAGEMTARMAYFEELWDPNPGASGVSEARMVFEWVGPRKFEAIKRKDAERNGESVET
ncbi:hypothetical protein PRZ48_005267 [Zasmidium cellare]|uniref:SprT-like domain-containing protein n=1 Tax=Zasmidium cellare TaxID=395010 RepID=A0ABR0ETC7_ZASCE|nr:hypothetical protein PRZ48_005267 [Zasmidium cellare]